MTSCKKNFLHPFLLLAALIVLGAGITAWILPRPPLLAEHEITVAIAQQIPNPLWIDARSAAEFSQTHIPGAHSLNEDNWSQTIAGVLAHWQPGQPIIVYCSSATCIASHAIANRLRGPEYQLAPVYVLHGGWETWQKQTKPSH